MNARGLSLVVLLSVLLGFPGRVVASSVADAPTASSVRSIRAAFLVDTAGRTISGASLRVAPLVAIANRYFMPIGFRVDVASITEVDSLPGATIEDALRNLRSSGPGAGQSFDVVIGLLSSELPGGHLGLAYPYSVCDRTNGYLAVSWLGDDAAQVERAGSTFAHELGHATGANHDPRRYENGLVSIMHPDAFVLTGGFAKRAIEEINSLVALSSGQNGCLPTTTLSQSQFQAALPPELEVTEGETLRWTVPMLVRAEGSDGVSTAQVASGVASVFTSIAGLPQGARFSVPAMTLEYTPGLDVVSDGQTERTFSLTVRVEEFSGDTTQTVLVRVKSSRPALSFTDGELTVLDIAKGRRLNYTTRIVETLRSGATVTCSAPPRGLRRSVGHGKVTISGTVRASGTITCTASSNGATGRKIFVLNVLEKARART